LEDLVLAAEGGVSENIDSEFYLENISTDAELQERKCLFCSQNITTGTIIAPPKVDYLFHYGFLFPIMFTWLPFINLRPPPSCYIVASMLSVWWSLAG
jgi:hypothetical protein